MTLRTYDAGPSLRDRLDKLDDRQLRLLVHFLDGAAQGETREQRWMRERMREGVEWLEGRGAKKTNPADKYADDGRLKNSPYVGQD